MERAAQKLKEGDGSGKESVLDDDEKKKGEELGLKSGVVKVGYKPDIWLLGKFKNLSHIM